MAFTDTQAFKDLKDIIQGDTLIPSDAGYVDALKRWSKLAEKPAGAVVYVKNNEDISAVIKFVVGECSLALGGGFGNLSGRHGHTIDNITSVTVVLADGQVVQASSGENEDLFFGIRGGGCNFGIVTEFTMRIHLIPPMCWGGLLTFSMDKVEALFDAMKIWQETIQTEDESAWIMMLSIPIGGGEHKKELLLACGHIGPASTGEERYKIFLDMGPIDNQAKEKTFAELNQQLDHQNNHGRNYYMTLASLESASAEIGNRFVQARESLLSAFPQVNNLLELEAIPLDKIISVPITDMAYAGRTDAKFAIIKIYWDDEVIDPKEIQLKAKEMIEIIEIGESIGKPTYANLGQQSRVTQVDKAKEFYGVNYRKLQTIKAKYDPDLVFDKWLPIQPLA